jgi:hypothetical protein
MFLWTVNETPAFMRLIQILQFSFAGTILKSQLNVAGSRAHSPTYSPISFALVSHTILIFVLSEPSKFQ